MSMLCKIADLITEVPEAGGMAPRCREYLWSGDSVADIVITEEMYRPHAWSTLSGNDYVYMETGAHFYANLLLHDGLMLHSSAVELNGYAYLFSGPCGSGKSTHTRLWQEVFGEAAQIFNDDKPALRRLDGKWYAYGTPWSGKNGINQNKKIPIAAICFLKQSTENDIHRMSQQEALTRVIEQTLNKFIKSEKLDLMLSHVGNLVREIPVFELRNRPEPEAVHLSHKTMYHAAKEAGL